MDLKFRVRSGLGIRLDLHSVSLGWDYGLFQGGFRVDFSVGIESA